LDSMPTAGPMAKSGKIRALAVTSARHAVEMPDVPTLQELGYKGFDVSSWYALLAPRGTPSAVVNRLNEELNRALAKPEVRERILKLARRARGRVAGAPGAADPHRA